MRRLIFVLKNMNLLKTNSSNFLSQGIHYLASGITNDSNLAVWGSWADTCVHNKQAGREVI